MPRVPQGFILSHVFTNNFIAGQVQGTELVHLGSRLRAQRVRADLVLGSRRLAALAGDDLDRPPGIEGATCKELLQDNL